MLDAVDPQLMHDASDADVDLGILVGDMNELVHSFHKRPQIMELDEKLMESAHGTKSLWFLGLCRMA